VWNFDVYAFGMICPSRLVVIKNGFPGAGQYAEIDSTSPSLGGEAANSAVVLRALGLTVRLDGNWLPNSLGSETIRLLSDRGIDVRRVLLKHIDGPEELVIASDGDRTVFGRYGAMTRKGKSWNVPHEDDVKKARVVCLDPFFRTESLKVSRDARTHGKPYVTVDCDPSGAMARDAAVIVISAEYRCRRYPSLNASSALKNYKRCRGLVVMTDGSREILYGRNGSPVKRHRPPSIRPIDTSGAGDSFRAGMVYALLKGMSDERGVQFSAGLAALNCLRFPGVLRSPSIKEVLSFIK
jgi:sugar/nucleoside kinase (ribokinase family)